MAEKKMILDLDTGIDDAMALLYVLGSPEVDLIGVTTSFGNVLVEDSAQNTLDLLHLLGREDVPVFLGAAHSSTEKSYEVHDFSKFIMGENGIGEVEIEHCSRQPEDTPAAEFIIEATKKYGKDLIYVPTGPMTTAAEVLNRYPEFKDEVGDVVIMGGALTVPGNVSPCAENNIANDPEAANAFFRSGTPSTMIGLDVCWKTLMRKEETQQWRDLGTKAGQVFADIADYYIRCETEIAPYLGGCGLYDPLCVAVAIDPSLVELFPINLQVDLEGEIRGRTIANPDLVSDPYKTTKAAIDVDAPRFMNEFMTRTMNKLREA